MRGALIGCGFFAQNHLNAWRDMRAEGIELVAVCDIDPVKAKAAADTFGVPRHYTDPQTLFESEQLDFVDIATRMETHHDLVCLAVRHGVRTIVQKPFASDWQQCVSMVETARAARVPLAVHENFRFQAPMQAVREVLASGAIGAPTWGRFAFRTGFDVYKTQPYFHQDKKLAILDVGIHVLDLARVFLGEVRHLSCETQQRNPRNVGEDTATMLLRHTSGAVSLVECTYEARQIPDSFPQTLVTIEGETGSIKVHEDFRMVVTSGNEVSERSIGSPLLPWTQAPWHVAQESVLLTQRAIIAAWRAGREAETSGADNLNTYALVDAAYAAAESGRAVAPEVWRGETIAVASVRR
ncbi:Gfo/Idh/MocA family oxidoreductase [Lichenifustis flavocetrariae]|uniref:Gfo/Idh/MocA family oxidoreductase n=1 Tax=Lichenifustis flavocetrariae TaxID=2949735 RepID=A0AA42CH40_9HYPH|nr:Gfo/Idh/MocA family oxidoreductase [Lichenifustis flavocetrariae]MCW6506874.1 Gfo/Idh/MocA family oxidoreductase [Lichenifustis flavocetrariae]